MQSDLWSYRSTMKNADLIKSMDLTGFKVEAVDGGIGKVDEASDQVGSSYVVVDTGPWIFGKKVLLPAGAVERIDAEDEKVFVDRTKDEIKAAPEFDPDVYQTPAYRERIGDYYGKYYRRSA
jgi:hypothetical protein